MTADTLAALVDQGRIEEVPPDAEEARAILEEAERHLSSADQIAGTDPNGAYALLYDAARKAVSAHMLAGGYRATNAPGAHRAVVLYAESELSDEAPEHVDHLDRMRRTRNRSEYGVRVFGGAEIRNDLEHASGVVSAVREQLGAG